jgi:hypothetical protein
MPVKVKWSFVYVRLTVLFLSSVFDLVVLTVMSCAKCEYHMPNI